MAEIAGRGSGYCGGKGGSMHIAHMALGHLGANAIVGGGIAHAVGAGLSYKRLGKDAVAVAFFGDGAMHQGVLYESMNLATLWNLPVVFVCINNQYGMGTRVDRATRSVDFERRAEVFGLKAEAVDGDDVEEVLGCARNLLDTARSGQPGFMTISCYRFFGHGRMDKSPYRTAAEEESGRKRDPVRRARERLCMRGAASSDELDSFDAAITKEMDEAVEFAISAPKLEVEAMFRDVFAAGEPEPESLRNRLDRILDRA